MNQGLATVKMRMGNKITVPQLWQIIHSQGYTPKATTILVRGEVMGTPGRTQLKVAESGEVMTLAVDERVPTSLEDVEHRLGVRVTVAAGMG